MGGSHEHDKSADGKERSPYELNMNDLFDQSRAYASLGMIDEARITALEALDMGACEEAARTWLVLLAYKRGDFPLVVTLGRNLLARGIKRSLLREYTALALHHLGQTREALSLLLGFEEYARTSLQSYLIACFLAATGESDEAVRHLLITLPEYRSEPGKTWIDGDLKALWAKFARGAFTLETAHRLTECEFDNLREWQAGTGTRWELDPTNYDGLPAGLRAVMRFDPIAEAYVIDYSKAPPGSALAVGFEHWMGCEAWENQARFDRARRIAWERVLDAQPRYALAAWRRGDLCAARHHVMWALENQPERIADFFDIPELGPLIDEMSRMLDSDWNFFAKLRRAYRLYTNDPEAALEILDELPAQWRAHPLLEEIRGHCLEASGNPLEGLACILRACDHSPQDAAHFLNAAQMALRHDWMELASAVMTRAPAAARWYQKWLETTEKLNGTRPSYYFPVRDFRGQPDLGGLIVEKSGAVLSRTAVETH